MPESDPAADEWLAARFDAQNTAHNPAAAPPTSRPDRRWSVDAGSVTRVYRVPWWPVVAGGRVLVASSDAVSALSAADGSVTWRFEPDAETRDQPTATGDAVLVGTTDETLHTLSVRDGSREESLDAPDWGGVSYEGVVPVRSPTVANGRLYVPRDGAFYVFDGSGRTRWRAYLPASTTANPAVVGETVVAAAGGAGAYAFRPSDRSAWESPTADFDEALAWQFSPGSTDGRVTVPVAPTVARGHAYVSTWTVAGSEGAGALYALDADTGEVQWRHEVGGRSRHVDWASTPAVADGTVYVGGSAGPLVALDADTGRVRWSAAFRDVRSVAVGGGVVVAAGQSGVAAFDAATGERHWHHAVGAGSGVALAGTAVYVTTYGQGPRPPVRLLGLG